jgi:hypothetical protein
MIVRARFLAFVAALVVFVVGLFLQITATGSVVAEADESMAVQSFRTGRPPELADRVGVSLADLQVDVLKVSAWLLVGLTVFVVFRKAFAALLAVVVAVPYAIFGAVNEIDALRGPSASYGLHGWALFCQQAGGPAIVVGAIATGITFALAHRVFLATPAR